MEKNKLGKIIKLPKIKTESQGSLTPIYSKNHIPFKINRVYYLYDVPEGSNRGGHAHINLEQFLVAISGSFTVKLFDGKNKESYLLNKPTEGLLINSMIWRELTQFSSNSICLALASLPYDENDYIRDRLKFININKINSLK